MIQRNESLFFYTCVLNYTFNRLRVTGLGPYNLFFFLWQKKRWQGAGERFRRVSTWCFPWAEKAPASSERLHKQNAVCRVCFYHNVTLKTYHRYPPTSNTATQLASWRLPWSKSAMAMLSCKQEVHTGFTLICNQSLEALSGKLRCWWFQCACIFWRFKKTHRGLRRAAWSWEHNYAKRKSPVLWTHPVVHLWVSTVNICPFWTWKSRRLARIKSNVLFSWKQKRKRSSGKKW